LALCLLRRRLLRLTLLRSAFWTLLPAARGANCNECQRGGTDWKARRFSHLPARWVCSWSNAWSQMPVHKEQP
jgi:hypothetical protein